MRYEPRDFRVKRPDGRGGWVWKIAGARRVLYRLPEVIAATRDRKTVFLVEGEKDADRLASLGHVATCKRSRPAQSDADFLLVEAKDCPMSSCAAPAGSPCRTGKGRVAAQYHTARFRLVPRLAKAVAVPVPPLRRPRSAWTELPRPPAADAAPAGYVRIGYARASTARPSLSTQTDALHAAGVTRVFAEKISTRAVIRPELDQAVALAGEIRASGAAVTIVVHEHKRLGRGIELAALAEQLRADGIGLEFLTGELQGSHDPVGVVFTVLAALAGSEREYIRDRTLEGHEAARARGKLIGGAAVTDDAMLAAALHLRSQEMSLRDIADRLVIATGKKRGQHPHRPP